jgi:hypothetical protein
MFDTDDCVQVNAAGHPADGRYGVVTATEQLRHSAYDREFPLDICEVDVPGHGRFRLAQSELRGASYSRYAYAARSAGQIA